MGFANESGWNIVIGRCHCPNLGPAPGYICQLLQSNGKECSKNICPLTKDKFIELINGAIRVMGRRICADDECDGKHPGWDDCVMFRRWIGMANKVLEIIK